MGAHVREDHEKFHAIAGPLPALYEALQAVIEAQSGPVEIDVRIRGAVNKEFSADVENPEELLEMLRLTLGK